MIPLEQAIEKRDEIAALQSVNEDPSQAALCTSSGVSMLMLSLYYELPQVAATIRSHLNSVSFFEAASIGEIETIRNTIIQDPRMVDAKASDGFTVLGLAIFFRQPHVASLLIEAGADVNLPAANARKVAPIHAACARQDLASLRLLLSRGANPNAKQEGGFTPLRQAIQSGHREMEQILRDAGAVDD